MLDLSEQFSRWNWLCLVEVAGTIGLKWAAEPRPHFIINRYQINICLARFHYTLVLPCDEQFANRVHAACNSLRCGVSGDIALQDIWHALSNCGRQCAHRVGPKVTRGASNRGELSETISVGLGPSCVLNKHGLRSYTAGASAESNEKWKRRGFFFGCEGV